MIEQETQNMISVDFVRVKRLIDCQTKTPTRTACVKDYYENKYGTGIKNFTESVDEYARVAMGSIDEMEHKTGCKLPCSSWEYVTNNIARTHLSNQYGLVKDKWKLIGRNTSSVLVITHMPSKQIRIKEELPKYTPIGFISDVGGICGIFLGISFISIFDCLIDPIVKRLENNFRKK